MDDISEMEWAHFKFSRVFWKTILPFFPIGYTHPP